MGKEVLVRQLGALTLHVKSAVHSSVNAPTAYKLISSPFSTLPYGGWCYLYFVLNIPGMALVLNIPGMALVLNIPGMALVLNIPGMALAKVQTLVIICISIYLQLEEEQSPFICLQQIKFVSFTRYKSQNWKHTEYHGQHANYSVVSKTCTVCTLTHSLQHYKSTIIDCLLLRDVVVFSKWYSLNESS